MAAFWRDFSASVAGTKDLKISDVIDALDADLGSHFFPARADGADPRSCTACGNGRLGLRLGRQGAFIGCSNYPECRYTRSLAASLSAEGEGDALRDGMRGLGPHPVNGEEITVRRGPYGIYVQQGTPDPEDKKAKPRRASLPKGLEGDAITLDQAVGLLALPRIVGAHPATGEPIEAGLGRFGPYVKMGAIYGSLEGDDDVLTVGLNRAVDAIEKKLASVRSLGAHPKDGEGVLVRKGRFGPYAQHGGKIANLPRGVDMNEFTLDEAVALLAEKGKAMKARGKPGGKPGAKRAAPAKAPKVVAEKAPAAKKAPARKKAPAKKKTAARRTSTSEAA